jgi:hypothetical protein
VKLLLIAWNNIYDIMARHQQNDEQSEIAIRAMPYRPRSSLYKEPEFDTSCAGKVLMLAWITWETQYQCSLNLWISVN